MEGEQRVNLKNKNNWHSSERKENAFHFFFFACCNGYNTMSSESSANPGGLSFFTATDSVFYSLADFVCVCVPLCMCGCTSVHVEIRDQP